MASLFKRMFGKDQRPVLTVVEHPVLGRMVYSTDREDWESKPGHRGLTFRFAIAGDRRDGQDETGPDRALVLHAETIALDPQQFQMRVREFLNAEVRAQSRLQRLGDEVAQLEIDTVCLMWPERPNDGMILFRGPADDRRSWRCDYVEREPKWLGFDT